MKNDDIMPEAYKYFWAPEAGTPLNDFLTKVRVHLGYAKTCWIYDVQFKPSMVQNDGTKPWIWVLGPDESSKHSQVQDKSEVVKEAKKLLKEVTEKVESIKNDDSIPVRSNKKTGAKSKKEVREQVQAEATERLKELSLKHGYVSGKWLVFAPAERVDYIWSGIASSLVSGPLRDTSADSAKVSTTSENENPHAQHIICIYLPNVYNKEKVTEVMKILLRNHGVNLSGVKSNLYTEIGIDSKHPSGIPSTVWKNSSILTEKEIKELKDAHFADLGSTKPGPTSNGGDTGGHSAPEAASKTDTAPPAKSQSKPKLKKKVNDPFASDDDEVKPEQKTSNSTETTQAMKGKTKPKLKKKAAADPFVSDSDDNGAETSRQKKTAKSTTAGKKRAQSDIANASDEEPVVSKKKK